MSSTVRAVLVTADLGLLADASVDTGTPQRMLLSIDVHDVDGLLGVNGLLGQVTALGGQVDGPANDMPWGRRWRT
jgi:hypothetical protein